MLIFKAELKEWVRDRTTKVINISYEQQQQCKRGNNEKSFFMLFFYFAYFGFVQNNEKQFSMNFSFEMKLKNNSRNFIYKNPVASWHFFTHYHYFYMTLLYFLFLFIKYTSMYIYIKWFIFPHSACLCH